MTKVRNLIVLFVALVVLGGCSTRLVDFTVISSKNVNVPTKQKGQRVTGEDCVFVFISIPFGIPNMKEAIDRAIETAGPSYDALVDGVVYQTHNPFQMCFKVEGTPINTKSDGSRSNFQGKDMIRHSKLSVDIAPN